MTATDKSYFEALRNRRANLARALKDAAASGVWNSVVEKYSDQAHFIYELLQNADDAGATYARFVLEDEYLIFAHNGTRHFTITDPANEKVDIPNKKHGDVNAITAIGASGKSIDSEAKIGKFGVGFKAVFQYTLTPKIYDPKFAFELRDYIVPCLLSEDFQGRKKDETLFVFPFDRPDKTSEVAHSDIAAKLKALNHPILFLSNLKEISYEIKSSGYLGLYGKELVKEYVFENDTLVEKLCLRRSNGNEIEETYLLLFSRKAKGLQYSVGYLLDKEEHLIPTKEPAFCFFPTKETTGLNFIIHAPFLLTDSREGVRAGVDHNKKLIQLLAVLAADAIEIMRDISEEEGVRILDDKILDVIPIESFDGDEDDENNVKEIDKISFEPFYKEIKKCLSEREVLPARSGYAFSENACFAGTRQMAELFSDEQMAELYNDESAKLVFQSLGYNELERHKKALANYIRSIVYEVLSDEEDLFNLIDSLFIENQDTKWLHLFYKWLSSSENRTELAKNEPFFLDQDSNAVPAYEDDALILFMPSEYVGSCRTVRKDFLENKTTVRFFEKIGLKEPSIKDEFYNVLVPKYSSDEEFDKLNSFKIIFNLFNQIKNEEIDDLISTLSNIPFLPCSCVNDDANYFEYPSDAYFSSSMLVSYFEAKPNVMFADIDAMLNLVGKRKEKSLNKFLEYIGVQQSVCIKRRDFDQYSASYYEYKDEFPATLNISYLPNPYSTRKISYNERYIDGCRENINFIVFTKKSNVKSRKEKSILLWEMLLKICSQISSDLDDSLESSCEYFYRTIHYQFFQSRDAKLLKESAWLLNKNGKFCKPSEIRFEELSEEYNLKHPSIEVLIEFLKMDEAPVDEEDDENANLTDEQREKMRIADKLKAAGKTEADFDEWLRKSKEQEERQEHRKSEDNTEGVCPQIEGTKDFKIDQKTDDFKDDGDESSDDEIISEPKHKLDKSTSRVAKDIFELVKKKESVDKGDGFQDKDINPNEFDDTEDCDEDDFTPPLVDFSKRAERAKEKAAREVEKISRQEDLQKQAQKANKYSYGWFKTLLEMEALASKENNSNNKEVSISFGHVEREPGSQRTLVLKHPNRYIPQFMEELTDIPLTIRMGEQTKKLPIEVANVKSYTLRVKLKSHVNISDIDFSKVDEAKVDAQSPVFLLEELKKGFYNLDLDDNFDMQENLCENIEFVFGPPGTGKTTYLAKDVLLPMMREERDLKVLVLTPTNKAADVLVRRVMDVSGGDKSYENWLVRFGGTGDEVIEQSRVYRDKTFDIRTLNRNVTATTIARFPYDFFMPAGERLYLREMKWDYIVIDEASMIPLVNIIYPLYKKTPEKFIIAGDPFQIEPIVSVDLWKDENIYSMVNLNSFIEPKTIPYDYKVKLLTTQYRSIPSVGRIFSEFAYGGILTHHRKETEKRSLKLPPSMDIKPLNFIKFPVSKYESIYRAKRLNKSSSYQIYSALFTFEYVSFLAKEIAKANKGSNFKIGVITPYRAQGDLIEKLIGSDKLPQEVDVQVGTIHGFQGDECDIIFAVFNSPPGISDRKGMFLNKRNIINVAISRAKDYLFVVMPDKHTENIQNLKLVMRVESLIKRGGWYTEMISQDLEEAMFGSSTYLEDNSFSTGHQNVNVYGLPEKRYEIRSEDSAIDVQIHRLAKQLKTEKVREEQSVCQSLIVSEKHKEMSIQRPVQTSDEFPKNINKEEAKQAYKMYFGKKVRGLKNQFRGIGKVINVDNNFLHIRSAGSKQSFIFPISPISNIQKSFAVVFEADVIQPPKFNSQNTKKIRKFNSGGTLGDFWPEG